MKDTGKQSRTWIPSVKLRLTLKASISLPAYSHGLMSKAVAIWLFDEDGGKKVTDYAGNHHDGEFEGKPDWVAGKFGSALKFSGADENQWVDIERPVVVDTVDFSIGCWLFPGAPQHWHQKMSSPVAMQWNRTKA